MNPNVRSSLTAAAIALVAGLAAGFAFSMGSPLVFALAMAVLAFVGTLVISTIISSQRRNEDPR